LVFNIFPNTKYVCLFGVLNARYFHQLVSNTIYKNSLRVEIAVSFLFAKMKQVEYA